MQTISEYYFYQIKWVSNWSCQPLDVEIFFYERFFVVYRRIRVVYRRKRRGYRRIFADYRRFPVVYRRFNKNGDIQLQWMSLSNQVFGFDDLYIVLLCAIGGSLYSSIFFIRKTGQSAPGPFKKSNHSSLLISATSYRLVLSLLNSESFVS